MIKDEETAKEISRLMLEFGKALDESIILVEDNCSTSEFASYRKAVGKVMGIILLDILNPLYSAHPDIRPIELGLNQANGHGRSSPQNRADAA